ncbi:hypothetical protein GCM10007876_25800 [Litoribrevibacter albus]|uniref:DUF3422 domain-containing protein n=2 Tax=Litoribrevibacter albus TaxID=1473156 RepID=A0AA37SB95_9GAMM|nr:hypothetical protein GCM10007876_25800 [Litoribrevibacter albus]
MERTMTVVEDLEIQKNPETAGMSTAADTFGGADPKPLGFGLNWHPDRHQLYDELHTRPFPVIKTPVRVSHFACLYDVDGKRKAYQHLLTLCARYGVNTPAESVNCYYQNFGSFDVRWEAHTEFCTYTIIRSIEPGTPFEQTALSTLPADWVAEVPGEVVAAIHVEMLDQPNEIPSLNELHDYFEGHRLIGCVVDQNQARLWTAFRPHGDGFGRVLVYNRSLNSCQSGRLLRRLLELETYRSMALLGLPKARSMNKDLTDLELALAEVTQEISDIQGVEDEKRLLGKLSKISAQIEWMISAHSYRFSATNAYYELVMARLKELREEEVSGLLTMTEFLSRRMTPAFRTCQATSDRMDTISRRVDRASELLRTRIDMVIEQQNQYLLKSMDRRSKLQLYMQQTVEGLSVAAISYYLLALFDLMLGASHLIRIDLDHKLIIGVSAPLVLLTVWFSQKRLKKKINAVNQKMKQKQRVTEQQRLE